MAGLGHISKLPLELIEGILDGLCTHHVDNLRDYARESEKPFNSLFLKLKDETASFAGLASLCVTSKQLNQLATWRLYHSLTGQRMWQKFMLIARTLIQRPDLAALVRHITMAELFYTNPQDSPTFPPEVVAYYAEQLALAPNASLRPGHLTRTGDQDDDYETSQSAAALAVLTSLCPNLVTIDFTTTHDPVAFAFCPAASLSSLRDVQVQYWDTEMGYEMVMLAPLLRAAPNIKRLRLFQVGCAVPLEEEEKLRLKHLTDLELKCCYMPADEFAAILRLCPNLQRLEYECGGCAYGQDQFDPVEAADAMLEHAPKLQKFELYIGDWLPPEGGSEKDVYEAKRVLDSRGIEFKLEVSYGWKVVRLP